MRSERAKVLHPILGRPLCAYPIARALEVGSTLTVAVVGHQADEVKQAIETTFPGKALGFALQKEQRGTADAVKSAQSALAGHDGPVLILYGDVPLLRSETLQALVDAFHQGNAPLAMVTTSPADPTGYGRVVREGGQVKRVVEHKDCTPEERKLQECNAGVYVADSSFLWDALSKIGSANAQGEFYLTDLVQMASQKGSIPTLRCDFAETAGVNDRAELAACAKVLQERINTRHMKAGVTMHDPSTTYISEGVELGTDCELGPQVTLLAGCRLGKGVRVGQGCVLSGARVGDGVDIKPYSVFEEAVVGAGSLVGPFARLRPGTELSENVHIGNFVETKKARIGKGSKANHLSYLGDAEIGSGVNVGAGTITCNYDGKHKHLTTLGDNVFIGSDTQLVAPVTVGDGAYVAAGTTVTQDVPSMALALSRTPQVVKEGWVTRKKQAGGEGPTARKPANKVG
jgi:bifunctional UDP-N-acetylglucosamine pyrophosphorylase/glucosamine-1-phosphate N-acetyltransferase